jgi:MFS family permease
MGPRATRLTHKHGPTPRAGLQNRVNMNKEEKKIMGLTTASHGLVHLYEGVLPPLIPLMMGVFGTDYFHMGLVVTVFSYAFGLGSLPAGYLSDKVGPRRLVTVYLFGAGFFALFIGAAGSLVFYGALMGFIGLFSSIYHPAANTLISLALTEKGKGFGIHGIAGSLGVAVVPVISAWIGWAMGWKAPHILFGVLGIAVGLYSLTVPRSLSTGNPAAPGGGSEPGQGKTSYLNLVVFFLSSTALGLTYKGIMTFLPAYMGEKVHLSFMQIDTVTLGGTVATLALLSGALGQYVSGRLLDRHRPETLYLAAVGVGTVFVFIMAMVSDLLLVLSAVVYAFFYFAVQPAQNYLVSVYVPKHRQGMGYGILFFLTFGVGSTAAAVSGYLADHYGLASVFHAMGLCFIASFVMVLFLFLRTRAPKNTERENRLSGT